MYSFFKENETLILYIYINYYLHYSIYYTFINLLNKNNNNLN